MNFFRCLFCWRKREATVSDEKFPRASQSDNETKISSLSTKSQVQVDEKLQYIHCKPIAIEGGPSIHDPLAKLNRALVVSEKRTYKIVNDIPYPTLKSADEIIISNRAVGLNPIDWKSVEFNFCLPEFPWITGREVAGVVKAIGANVKELKVGDRVWASTYYKDRRAGCFQQYVAVPQHTVTRIPDNLDFESASCLGVAGLTAAMTLWKWLDVPIGSVSRLPAPSSIEYIVIWGGSTVTGQFAIQIAIRSGLRVIAVASEKTRPLVLSLGATHIVTRDGKTNDEIVSEIRTLGGDNITRAVDLVGAETAKFCLELFSTAKPGLFAPLAMISSDTYIPENIRVKSVEMKQFILNPESRIYATELNRLVSAGLVIMPTIEVLNGGLDSVESGLERLKSGDMAGKKLVVRMLK